MTTIVAEDPFDDEDEDEEPWWMDGGPFMYEISGDEYVTVREGPRLPESGRAIAGSFITRRQDQ